MDGTGGGTGGAYHGEGGVRFSRHETEEYGRNHPSELKMSGNFLNGSRGVVNFKASFDQRKCVAHIVPCKPIIGPSRY